MTKSAVPPLWNNAKLKQQTFDTQVRSPGAWLLSAMDLKTAADRLNWRDFPIRDDEPSLSLFAVYRMLIGMAIESLLKGIMAAQGMSVLDANGNLAKAFSTHDLHKLADNVDGKQFAFTAEERRILKEITPYIEWGGRYPIPKVSVKLITKMHSSIDMEIERKLYDRLYEHLANIGWIIKAGKRLDLRPKKST